MKTENDRRKDRKEKREKDSEVNKGECSGVEFECQGQLGVESNRILNWKLFLQLTIVLPLIK